MEYKLIGLSLSQCVADIIKGNAREDNVEKIIARTAVKNAADLDELINNYRNTYWADNPDLGEEIARRLFEENKVEQPRLLDNSPVPECMENGIWKERKFAFTFTTGDVFYAKGRNVDAAYQKIEGVLDDMDEDDECSDEEEILEGTPEWDNFEESF